jgi:hypothetical protein
MAGVAVATRMLDEQELMRLLLARYTLKECAALMGCAYPTVCARARRPVFLDQLKGLSEELYAEVDRELRVVHGALTERIVSISSRALDKLEALMDAEDTDSRLVVKIAQDLLDRNPDSAKNTKQTSKQEVSFANPLVLVAAAKAAQEMDESTHGPLLEAS